MIQREYQSETWVRLFKHLVYDNVWHFTLNLLC